MAIVKRAEVPVSWLDCFAQLGPTSALARVMFTSGRDGPIRKPEDKCALVCVIRIPHTTGEYPFIAAIPTALIKNGDIMLCDPFPQVGRLAHAPVRAPSWCWRWLGGLSR